MTDSNNKQSGGFLSSAFGVAKKLSHTGIDLVQHVAPGSTSKEEAGSSQGGWWKAVPARYSAAIHRVMTIRSRY